MQQQTDISETIMSVASINIPIIITLTLIYGTKRITEPNYR